MKPLDSELKQRKCIGVLQENKQKQSVLSVSNRNVLVSFNKGKKRKSDENNGPTKMKRIDGIYEDLKSIKNKQKSSTSIGVQTEESLKETNVETHSSHLPGSTTNKDEQILHMLTSDTAPSEYWEELAEKRREALEETLIENKSLYNENKVLQAKVVELKEENKLLNEMVNEAKELAQLVKTLTSDEDPN